jgi:hypothetical protein
MSSARTRPSFRPQLEQIEDRCVPSVSGLAHTIPTGVPTTLGKVITIARGEVHALNHALSTILSTSSQIPSNSLAAALLNQSVQLTHAEVAAMNRLISRLQKTTPPPAPAPAYVKVFSLEVAIANANTALQTLQSQETVQGSLLPYSVPHF